MKGAHLVLEYQERYKLGISFMNDELYAVEDGKQFCESNEYFNR